jgi:hypothetical protein
LFQSLGLTPLGSKVQNSCSYSLWTLTSILRCACVGVSFLAEP